MLKYGSNDIGKVYLGSNSIGKAYYGSELVFQTGIGPTPPTPSYTVVEYIETDGYAYINTGILGNDPRSAEIKCTPTGERSYILASSNESEGSGNYVMLYISTGGEEETASFGHNYFYSGGMPSVQDSCDNSTPFEARISMRKGAQSMSVKQYGEASYSTVSKSNTSTITTNRPMFLFASNTGNGAAGIGDGVRIYYCKIYSDATYSILVFNGVPCYCGGEYGLWDMVTNSFFGNAAGSGAFTGPSII